MNAAEFLSVSDFLSGLASRSLPERCEGARMSRLRNGGSQLKNLAVVPGRGNGIPTARGVPPEFDGTIA